MSHDDSNRAATGERLGLALFLVGAFPLVLVAMSILRPPAPNTELSGLAGLAQAIAAGFGQVAPLILSLGLVAIGVALFLGIQLREPGRHVAGVAGIALGVVVVLGALENGMGGRLGARLGGTVAGSLGTAVGLALGGALIVGTVGLAWLRDYLPVFEKSGGGATLGTALTESDYDGVSAAEANMLVPDESTLEYMEDLWRHASEGPPQVVPVPPSPYPDDVRLRGEVPEGATPITPASDDLAQTEPDSLPADTADQPGGWQRSTAERTPPVGPGGTVAPVQPGGADDSPAVRPVRNFRGAPGLTAGIPIPTTTREQAEDPFRERSSEDLNFAEEEVSEAESAGADAEVPALRAEPVQEAPLSAPPRPSWEQDDLFEGEQDGAAELGEEAELEESEEEEFVYVDEDGNVIAAEDVEEEVEEDSEVEAEYEEESEEDSKEEDSDPEAEYEEDEEEDSDPEAEYDEAEEDEEEPEAEAAELEEGEEADEEEEGEEYEYVYVDEDGNEVAAEDEDEDAEEDAEEYEEVAEDSDEEEEGDEAEEAAEYEEEGSEDEEEEYEVAEEEEEPVAEAPEPEVVLTPQAGPPKKGSKAKSSSKAASKGKAKSKSKAKAAAVPEGEPVEQLVHDCGRLFVEEGRVAVSLLQRRHGLAFDEACEVLDHLQQAGLIGPYRGGKRREILLTLEEWEARGASAHGARG